MDFLGLIALGAALAGLIAIVFEIARKRPSAFLDIATNAARFAREPIADSRPTSVRAATAAPANDRRGLRAA